MFLKNYWYMAAWDYELVDHHLLARTLLNEPVLIYRGMSGEIHAMEDRCCHRGAALSDGRMEGDFIRCMYHGLKFDTQGKVIEIPGQERIPPDMGVKTYPVVADGRLIWIWMGDAKQADKSKIPHFWFMDDPEWYGKPGYIHYKADYMLVVDNLCDITHMAWVHTNTLCGSESYAYKVKDNGSFEVLDEGCRITYTFLNGTPPPYLRRVLDNDKPLDRRNIAQMTLPGTFSMETRFVPAGQGAAGNWDENAYVFNQCQIMTPETAGSSHFFFEYRGKHKVQNNDAALSLHNSMIEGFNEDIGIIEHQQVVLDADPHFKLRAIARDRGLALLRSLTEKAIAREQASAQPPAEPVRVRRAANA